MIEFSTKTDTGRQRQLNEDRCLANPTARLFMVADGMGGHAAGAEAAQLTVSTIEDFVQLAQTSQEITFPFGYYNQAVFEHNVLRTAVCLANLRVFQQANALHHFSGMGSTVVVLWIKERRAYYVHVGDSRLYLLRQGQIHQLTEDHSLVQEQLKAGIITEAEVHDHELRHVVTQAIGMQDGLEPEVEEVELVEGDQLLLCCDGLTDEVAPEEIEAILNQAPSLESACQQLVAAANDRGGRDNITAVLVRIDGVS